MACKIIIPEAHYCFEVKATINHIIKMSMSFEDVKVVSQ